jgi:HlyD family secretion protein
VTSTRARLDALKNGGIAAARAQAEAQKQQAQSQLTQAQASFKVAQANLAAAQNGNLDAQVKQAQAQVTAARERLKVDETRLDVVNRGATDEDLQQAQAMLDQAQQQLAKAQRPFSSFDIQAQEQAVAQAAAQLQKAQHPFTDQDQMAARAAVDQAMAAASLAELGLRETRVVAPASGAVAERLVAPGSMVGPTTPVITLIPPSVELLVNVEESQLGRLAEGQAVQIAVPAFAGETFAGRVSSIAPNVDARTRTAGVRIQPDDSDGRLKAGMSATASVVTARKEAALVVPRTALKTGSPSLLVVDANERVRKVPVKLGLQGDEGVEILEGLQDGQLVITSNLNDLREGDLVAPRVEAVTARAMDGQ